MAGLVISPCSGLAGLSVLDFKMNSPNLGDTVELTFISVILGFSFSYEYHHRFEVLYF